MRNRIITSELKRRRRAARAFAAALFVLAAVLTPGTLAAEDGSTEEDLFGSEGDLFGGDLIEEATEDAASATDGVEELLTNEAAKIGGKFALAVDLLADPEEIESLDDLSSTYTLAPTVYIDSRPDAEFRVYIKSGVTYTTGGASPGASLNVEELFSDVTLADWLYLRAGKQNMGWGVGYFFSPADLVSLEAIDPDDPEADLEGPVAVRLHLPHKTTNAYAYAMLDDLPDDGSAGWAGKLEFVLGSAELTAGGYYEEGSVSGAMATVSAGIWDFDVFAEAVAQYGSTFAMVGEEGPTLVTDRREDTWFALATAGARYTWSDDYDYFDLTLLGQYYYNGEGYEDPSILQDDRIGMLLAAGDLAPGDFVGAGRHYAGANVLWNEAFGTDLSPSAFWIGNLTDGSGRLTVNARYRLNDYVTFTPGYTYTYGDDGEEYAPAGAGHELSLSLSLGRGEF